MQFSATKRNPAQCILPERWSSRRICSAPAEDAKSQAEASGSSGDLVGGSGKIWILRDLVPELMGPIQLIQVIQVQEVALVLRRHVEVENGRAGIVAIALGVGDAVVRGQDAGPEAALIIAAAETLALAHGSQGGPA